MLRLSGITVVVAVVLFTAPQARAANIIEEWGSVKTPPAPALQAVTVDPKTTALLVVDVLHQTCNEKRRPRCVAILPTIKKFLAEARNHKMLVVYTDVPHKCGRYLARSRSNSGRARRPRHTRQIHKSRSRQDPQGQGDPNGHYGRRRLERCGSPHGRRRRTARI
jgi:hypothetical protein